MRGLIDAWNMIEKERRVYHNNSGIVYLGRDEHGTIKELYFKTFEDFEKVRLDLNYMPSMFVDLSERAE